MFKIEWRSEEHGVATCQNLYIDGQPAWVTGGAAAYAEAANQRERERDEARAEADLLAKTCENYLAATKEHIVSLQGWKRWKAEALAARELLHPNGFAKPKIEQELAERRAYAAARAANPESE